MGSQLVVAPAARNSLGDRLWRRLTQHTSRRAHAHTSGHIALDQFTAAVRTLPNATACADCTRAQMDEQWLDAVCRSAVAAHSSDASVRMSRHPPSNACGRRREMRIHVCVCVCMGAIWRRHDSGPPSQSRPLPPHSARCSLACALPAVLSCICMRSRSTHTHAHSLATVTLQRLISAHPPTAAALRLTRCDPHPPDERRRQQQRDGHVDGRRSIGSAAEARSAAVDATRWTTADGTATHRGRTRTAQPRRR